MAGRPGRRGPGARRTGGAATAQLPGMGAVRPSGLGPRSGGSAPVYRRSCRCGGLHPRRRRRAAAAGAGRWTLEATGPGARGSQRPQAGGAVGLQRAGPATGGGGRARGRRRRLAAGRRQRTAQAPRRPPLPGLHRLYLRHHRSSKRGDAEPPQHALGGPRRPDRDRRLRAGSAALLPAPVPHPGAHRRLLSADDGRRRRRLFPLGGPTGGGSEADPAYRHDRGAAHLREGLRPHPGSDEQAPGAGALAVRRHRQSRLAPLRTPAGARRLAFLPTRLAAAAAAGGGQGKRPPGRASASGGERRGAAVGGHRQGIHRHWGCRCCRATA